MTDPNVVIRLVVNGEEAVVPAFRRAEAAGRSAGRGIERAVAPAAAATDRLQREALDAGRALGQMTGNTAGIGRLAASFGSLRSILVGGGIALGLGAIVRAGREASAELADIGDRADRLSVSPEFLQQIEQAQAQLGQPSNNLEQSLAALNRRIGEANAGSAESQRIFGTLGVALRDAEGNARTLPDVFRDVADRIASIEDPTQRAAVAQRLFEEGGRNLLPLLAQGADGFDRLNERSAEAGRIFGDSLVRASQDAQIALNNLERDAVNPITEALGRAANGAIFFLERLTTALEFQSTVNIVTQLPDIEAQIAEQRALLTELQREAVFGPDALFEQRNRNVQDAEAELRRLEAQLGRGLLTLQSRGLDRGGRPVAPQTPENPVTIDFSSGGGSRGSRPRQDTTAERLAEGLERRLEAQERELQLIGLEGVARAELSAELERQAFVTDLLEAAGAENATITQEQIDLALAQADAIAEGTVRLAEREAELKRVAEAQRETERAEEDFNRSLSDTASGLADVALNARTTREALRGVLDIVVRLVEQGLEGKGILGDLLGGVIPAISSGIGGFFGGTPGFADVNLGGGIDFGSVDLSGLTFARGGVFQGGQVVPFARGGIVDRPTFFPLAGGRTGLMGEAGLEGIIPLARGPGGTLGVRAFGGDGGRSGGNTFNIYGPVDERVASRLPSLSRAADAQADAEAARMAGRGRRREI